MKKKLRERGSSAESTNPVGRSFTGLRTAEEPKDKVHTQEVDGESYLNTLTLVTKTLDSVCRHPFIDSIIGVPLPEE